MTMFSSRPPFNDDPRPYVMHIDGYPSKRYARHHPNVDEYAPRPEFDRPQSNPTNPILAELREGVSADASNDWVATYLATLPDWEEGEVGHARRVLTRLARFAEANA